MSTILIHCLTLTYRNSMIKLYMKKKWRNNESEETIISKYDNNCNRKIEYTSNLIFAIATIYIKINTWRIWNVRFACNNINLLASNNHSTYGRVDVQVPD